MDLNEFRDFVIKNAQKYIFEGDEMQLDEKGNPKTSPKILKPAKPVKAKTPPKEKKPAFQKNDVNKALPEAPPTPKSPVVAESFSPEKIKLLAEEMKKINKKIDLRNPLINPELFDIISEEKITNKEEKQVVKEESSKRWKDLYNYEIPKDELR